MYIRAYELDSQEPIVNYRFESAGDLKIAENMMKLCHCRFDPSRMNYDISTDPKVSVPIEDGKTNMYYVHWDDVVHNNALWGSDQPKTPCDKVSNRHYMERLNYSDVAYNKPKHSPPLHLKPQVTILKKSTPIQSPITQSSASDVRVS